MQTSQAGIDLIKEFEGFEHKAYPDPGTGGEPWTIGYGRAYGVKPSDTVTREEAEEMLRVDLRYFEAAVIDLVEVELSQHEFDALVSFTYNCGEGALAESTLRKRLNAGEPKCPVFQQELPRWVRGANGPLAGLVRRRQAEADLACKAGKIESESYLERAAWYYASEPHQRAAWRALESLLSDDALAAFKRAYRTPQAVERPAPKPEEPKFPLDVEYFYQRDSKTGHGERMCFTSSMAMALDYIDPDVIKGDDDWYLQQVLKYGDTVSSEAQVAAARSLGYDCEFHVDGRQGDLERLLDAGYPVPIGILHKGSVSSPAGGGHWICLIGHDETHFMVHDPFGELALVGGGYPKAGPEDGKNQRYTKKNLMKRWLIANDHDGWYMDLTQTD